MQVDDFLTLDLLLSLLGCGLKFLGFLFLLLNFLFESLDFDLRPFIRGLEAVNVYRQPRRLNSGPFNLVPELLEL